MNDTTRELGIEFGTVRSDFDAVSYPISNGDLLEHHGDSVLLLPNGEVTLREILAPLDQESYVDRADVSQAVFNMVGDHAIGRKFYSDRDPPALGEDHVSDELSF